MAEQETSTLSAFNPVKLPHNIFVSNSVILENTFCFIDTYIPKSLEKMSSYLVTKKIILKGL